MGLGGVNSGGLSKGGANWPSGKPQGPKSSEEVFSLNRNVGAADASSSASIQKTGDTPSSPSQVQATLPTRVSQLGPEDISKQLATIDIPLTDNNKELALLMAVHGIEISEDSFALINKLLKGKNSKEARESAVLLVSKGLGEAADDVGILNQLLTKQSTISKSLNQLSGMQKNMMAVLQDALKNHPGLQSFLSVFDEFNDQLKQFKKIEKANQWLSQPLSALDDSMAMASFLKGLGQRFGIKSDIFLNYIKSLGGLNAHLMGQIILSQDSIKQPLGLLESFHYFQIPNPLTAQAFIELLLRKQSVLKQSKQKAQDTSPQEKIIVNMESETMGKITVIVVVMGFKVWCTIHSDQDHAVSHINSFRKELVDNLKKYDYSLEAFQSSRKTINIQKFIAPSQDISEVKRIQTEI
ncbi:MAG: hypothetical protein ISQ13_02275 [Candidatus Margulisbacteria bacterium]|nr:hypothetical protein [Candidatus Margulisiibacteriota bacterium]